MDEVESKDGSGEPPMKKSCKDESVNSKDNKLESKSCKDESDVNDEMILSDQFEEEESASKAEKDDNEMMLCNQLEEEKVEGKAEKDDNEMILRNQFEVEHKILDGEDKPISAKYIGKNASEFESNSESEDEGLDEIDSEKSDDEESSSVVDPYLEHFNYKISEKDCSEKLSYESKKVEWPEIGKFVHMKPTLQNSFCKEPSVEKKNIAEFALKKNLLNSILKSSSLKKMSKNQIGFFNLVHDYFDVLFMRRTYENGEKLRFVYTLHILNHILKMRAKVIHHNSKLSKNPDEEFRDQGFTRPVAVILVPFRHDCYRIISHISSLLPECAVMNKKRFETEYGPPPPRDRMKKKPQDFEQTFEGNINEDFKIGLKLKNKSITLFSEFYSSDLIIASPLGLRQIVGAEGDKDRDFDFLSSIEVLVIDRAEILMLQNPVHFLHVLKHLNLLPKESHGCNFFRVREYALSGMAKYYRQNILLSSVEHMWLEALIFKNTSFNYSGYLISGTDVKSPAMKNILIPVKLCFRWFDTETPETEIEDRFNFFINKVLPDYKEKAMSQTMIYIPSYFDFVRLRNYFRANELSSVMVCEYSKKGKIAQGRDVFFKGHRHFMLYTERAHFYSRYHIKGVQHIVFYQPPTFPGFFRELCNALIDGNPRRKFEERSCCVLASKHDVLSLKHIVGLNEIRHMLNSEKKIFVKYTEQ